MHGYATVSYNQILDHLQFWTTHIAVTAAVSRLKIFYVLLAELTFVWGSYE